MPIVLTKNCVVPNSNKIRPERLKTKGFHDNKQALHHHGLKRYLQPFQRLPLLRRKGLYLCFLCSGQPLAFSYCSVYSSLLLGHREPSLYFICMYGQSILLSNATHFKVIISRNRFLYSSLVKYRVRVHKSYNYFSRTLLYLYDLSTRTLYSLPSSSNLK